jgi:DNA polymerase-1
VKKKTASGAPSTDEEVLQELAADYPLPARILEHRSLAKLKGTYTDKLPLMVNPATGRVHTNYAQAVAVTGRLSSNDPNLQNIPIRTPEGRRVREAFIAPPGHVIVSRRLLADRAAHHGPHQRGPGPAEGLCRRHGRAQGHRQRGLRRAGGRGVSEQRRYAKVINFGLIYGMGAFGLASNLGIEQKAAATTSTATSQRFAGVKRYMDETKACAKDKGYVETPSAAACGCPRSTAATARAAAAPSARPSTRRCRARRPT